MANADETSKKKTDDETAREAVQNPLHEATKPPPNPSGKGLGWTIPVVVVVVVLVALIIWVAGQ